MPRKEKQQPLTQTEFLAQVEQLLQARPELRASFGVLEIDLSRKDLWGCYIR